MNINDLDKKQFNEIVAFEVDEKIKGLDFKFNVERPEKISLEIKMQSFYFDEIKSKKINHSNNITLHFEYKDSWLKPNEHYALKLCGHALMKGDLQQIYNTFIFDLVKKLDHARKGWMEYSKKRKEQEDKIEKKQLDIFKSIQKDYVYPRTLLLEVDYRSTLCTGDNPERTIRLPVEIAYSFGYGIYIKKDTLLYFSDIYFLIQKWDEIQKALISEKSMNAFTLDHLSKIERH